MFETFGNGGANTMRRRINNPDAILIDTWGGRHSRSGAGAGSNGKACPPPLQEA